MRIGAPAALSDAHLLDGFDCTSPELAKWLRERARKNQRDGASRCFVVCDERHAVVGYYALAAGAVSHEEAPGHVKRNMPDPIPVVVLGRLAVHVDWRGRGIGRGLLKDAVQRTLQASQQLGVRVLLCHAIDASAKAFYHRHGFVESPINAMTMMLNIVRLRETLDAADA